MRASEQMSLSSSCIQVLGLIVLAFAGLNLVWLLWLALAEPAAGRMDLEPLGLCWICQLKDPEAPFSV